MIESVVLEEFSQCRDIGDVSSELIDYYNVNVFNNHDFDFDFDRYDVRAQKIISKFGYLVAMSESCRCKDFSLHVLDLHKSNIKAFESKEGYGATAVSSQTMLSHLYCHVGEIMGRLYQKSGNLNKKKLRDAFFCFKKAHDLIDGVGENEEYKKHLLSNMKWYSKFFEHKSDSLENCIFEKRPSREHNSSGTFRFNSTYRSEEYFKKYEPKFKREIVTQYN